MSTTSNVLAFPVDRIRPTTGDVFDAFVTPIVGRAPIAVVDNSRAIALIEAEALRLDACAERARDFADAALKAGDAAGSADALARADRLEEYADFERCEAAHLAETNGMLQPSVQNWNELTPAERNAIIEDHFDWLGQAGGEPSIWYDLVVAHLRAVAA